MLMRAAIGLSLAVLGHGAAMSQTSTAPGSPPQPPPRACITAEYRQFDFWIGDWDVFLPDGKKAGTNRIAPVISGCVLHEQWAGGGNFNGQSFNAWDARRQRWHQTWMDSSGAVLLLDGRATEGSMTLSDSEAPGKNDRNLVNEIQWTSNADGSVRQHWRVSKDGGKTWTTAFDGKYVRSTRPQPSR